MIWKASMKVSLMWDATLLAADQLLVHRPLEHQAWVAPGMVGGKLVLLYPGWP